MSFAGLNALLLLTIVPILVFIHSTLIIHALFWNVGSPSALYIHVKYSDNQGKNEVEDEEYLLNSMLTEYCIATCSGLTKRPITSLSSHHATTPTYFSGLLHEDQVSMVLLCGTE